MAASRDAVPVNSFKGMAVLSLASGNKLGRVENLFLYPENGTLSGISIAADVGLLFAPYENIYSFGRDAIMVLDENSAGPVGAFEDAGRSIDSILGARVISEGGDILGQVAEIYLTLNPPPEAIFEVRRSLLDKLLGRAFYIPASAGHALSDDSQRLLIPNRAAETAAHDIREVLERPVTVRSFESAEVPQVAETDEDETVVRVRDEDETVVRLRDEDDTVVRMPRKAG